MIRALARAGWDRLSSEPVSRQKKDALFELAGRVMAVARTARAEGSSALAGAAAAERRKSLKYGLELLASGADAERLDQSYALDPVFRELDPGSRLELSMVRSGLASIAGSEHPSITFRRMTAYLGPDYFDKATAYLEAGARKRRRGNATLLVPGEMPDVIRTLAAEPPSLDRALRAAGRGLAVAALAGCPQESLDLAKPLFGAVGGAAIEDDAEYLRGRLSGDEIGQAQSAFLELVRNLEEGGELEMADEEAFHNDPEYVSELTRAVMGADEKVLKAVFTEGDKRSLARAMQGMSPPAHELILGLIAKRDSRRLLDAVDDAAILPRREVLEAGRAFARSFLAQAKRLKVGRPLDFERFARIRDWAEPQGGPPEQREGSEAASPEAGQPLPAGQGSTAAPPPPGPVSPEIPEKRRKTLLRRR